MGVAKHEWLRRGRWFAVAGVFTLVGLGLLKLFVDGLHWPYALSTLVQSETCNILRFFVNDRWVFGRRLPTWKRFGQYHVANALGFLVWWAGANGLKALGMHYLLASVVAMLGSFGVSWMTNFRWIWRKRHVRAGHEQAPEGARRNPFPAADERQPDRQAFGEFRPNR